MSLGSWWRELQGLGLEEGVHRYDGQGDWAHHRFHLRVDPDNKGALLMDASNILFLNGTALDYVRCALEGRDQASMERYMGRRYRGLDPARAREDYASIRDRLDRFVKGDLEAMGTMASDRPTFGLDDLAAPYRMDLILTYRCQNRCPHCYNEPRQLEELSVPQWKAVIGKLWSLGIPHIVFTGGEPTLHPGLDELISASESCGQVTGLVTNGRRLGDRDYLRDLIHRGLDHVQVTLLSYKESAHDALVQDQGAWRQTVAGLSTALAEDVYVSTNTTLMRSNQADAEETLRFLASLGVKNVAFNGLIRSGKGKGAEGLGLQEMGELLVRLRRLAAEEGVRMTWYTPTPYCQLNPINLGLGIKQCTACALSMAIEPDGTVLPCQSYYRGLGNIIHDDWKDIWGHELCRSIRERRYLDGECLDCGLREACGGGCPLAREHGDYACLDRGPG